MGVRDPRPAGQRRDKRGTGLKPQLERPVRVLDLKRLQVTIR